MMRPMLAVSLAAFLLPSGSWAAITGPQARMTLTSGTDATVLLTTDRVNLSMEVTSDGAGVGAITYTFVIKDPSGATVFQQTGNSAPGTVAGVTRATLSGVPVSRFFTTAGAYTLTATAALGATTLTGTASTQVRDPKIILQEPADRAEVSGSPLRFRWDPSASSYRLKVAEDTAFAKLKVNQVVTQTLFDVRQDATTLPQERLVGGALYYWTVEGLDSSGNVIARPDTYRTFKLKADSLPESRNLAVTQVVPSFRDMGQHHEITARVTVANTGSQPGGPLSVTASINGSPLVALGYSGTTARVDQLSPKGETLIVFRANVDLVAEGLRKPYMVTANLSYSDDNFSDNMKTVELNIPTKAAGACASNPCANGGLCTGAGSGFVCACQAGFSGQFCQDRSAAQALPATGGFAVSRVERQPVPQEWVENPNAAGAYATVKVTLANNLGTPVGPVRLTLRPVAAPLSNPPSQTIASIAPGKTSDILLNLPFREPFGAAQADYVAAWDVSGDAANSGFKTVSLDIPRRRSAAASAAGAPDLELAYAGQEDAPAGSGFVPVKFIARNLGKVASAATVRIRRLADNEELVPGIELKSLGVGQGEDSFTGKFNVPKAKLGAGEVAAVASVEAAGTEASTENNYKQVTLRVPAAASASAGECPTDYNDCTYDILSSGVCTHPTKPNGTACDDGNEETVGTACMTGQCAGGRPREKAPVAPTWGVTAAAAAAGEQSQDVTADVALKSGVAEGVYKVQLQLFWYNAKTRSAVLDRTSTPRFSEALDLSGGKKSWKIAFSGLPVPKNDGTLRQWRAYLQPYLNGSAQNYVARGIAAVAYPAAAVANAQGAPDLKPVVRNLRKANSGAWLADIEVKNLGKGEAKKFYLKNSVKMGDSEKGGGQGLVLRENLKGGGSVELKDFQVLNADSGDPVAAKAVLNATTILTDDRMLQAADADPSNDTVTVAFGAASAAVAAEVKTGPDLQVVLKNFAVKPAGGKFALSADVTVLNNGGAAVEAYKLAFGLTTQNGPVEISETRIDPPGSKGSRSLAGKTLFTALDRDPMKEMFALKATVSALDKSGRPVKDADPSNDTFTTTLGGLAAEGLPPDLLVELKNPKVERAADKTITLKTDAVVMNAGGSAAERYSLKFGLTTDAAPLADGPLANAAPLAAGGTDSQAGRTIFTKLTRDPIAFGDVLTASVVLEDDKGQALKDANPDNNTFTLKLVGESAPPPPRDISIKEIVIGETSGSKVPVTVKVVNDGPTKEPKITVALVTTSGWPGDKIESQVITDLDKNGADKSVVFRLPLQEAPAEVKFYVQLSVDPEDPVLTKLKSEEKTVKLDGPWYAGITGVPDFTDYFNIEFKPEETDSEVWGLFSNKSVLAKAAAWTAALKKVTGDSSGGMFFPMECMAIYGGPTPMKGRYRFMIKGMGDPSALKGLEEPRYSDWLDLKAPQPWKGTVKFDIPKADDQTVLFRMAVVDTEGIEVATFEKTAKVPGLKSEFFKKLMPEKHDLKVSEMAVGEGSTDVGDAEDGPMNIRVKIAAAGTVKEERSSIRFAVDGNELRTMKLPAIEAGSERSFSFHLPWTKGNKLKATVDIGEEAGNPDSKDLTPDNNAAEIDMPKRDLAVTEITAPVTSGKKAYFSQVSQKWPVNVTVANLGGIDESVEPPIIMVEGRVQTHTNTAARALRPQEKTYWTVQVEPDKDNRAVVLGAIKTEVKDQDSKNDLKVLVLQFPPKPPRLDLSILSVAVRPDDFDSKTLTVPIDVVIKNLGEGESLAPLLGVSPNLVKAKELTKLAKDAQAKVTLDFPLKETPQSVMVWLGPSQETDDADPSNNTKSVTVPRLPWDLKISEVTLGKGVDNEKRTAPVMVEVQNTGKTTVKDVQVSVTLGEAEYVSDPAYKPEIKAGKSQKLMVRVPLPAVGGPTKGTALVLGSSDGELNPGDNKKEFSLTLPDRPEWNLAITKVAVKDTALRSPAFPGFQVVATVKNTGVVALDGPTVSLTRKPAKGSWFAPSGEEPDLEFGKKKLDGKLQPGESVDVTFDVPNNYKGAMGSYEMVAVLEGQKDDKSEDDRAAFATIFEAKDLGVANIQVGDMVILPDRRVSIPVTVHVSNRSTFYGDKIYFIGLQAGGGKMQWKPVFDGAASADFTVEAGWGENVQFTAKVGPGDFKGGLNLDSDATPGDNVMTKTLSIPNPPVTIGAARVHDPSPGNNCFFAFPEFAQGFTKRGYRMSFEGPGVARFGEYQEPGGRDSAEVEGFPLKAHMYPHRGAIMSTGPWDFTLKLWRDNKVVFEKSVNVPAKPYNTALPPPTAENRALAAKRNYKVARIAAPTAAELAATWAKGERNKVPVKVELTKEWGPELQGKIPVRVRENGNNLGPDIQVTLGADGSGSAMIDVPIQKTRTARTFSAMIVDFEDANPDDDSLTSSFRDLPARPVFDAKITKLELGGLTDGKSSVKVTVTNIGDRTERDIPLSVYLEGKMDQKVEKKIASLAAKESTVVDFLISRPVDGRAHVAVADMNYNDDDHGNNKMSARFKLGYDYKVGAPVMHPGEISGGQVPFTVRIDRVSGDYPLKEMKLKINTTDPNKEWGGSAERQPDGSYAGRFYVPVKADVIWRGGVGATLTEYDDDDPSNNSGAVNVELPYRELYAGELVLTRKGDYYEAKLPINSQSNFDEQNVKVGLRMDGHTIDPDVVIPSVPKDGKAARVFRIPAHTAGKYEVKAGVLDRPDRYTENNLSTLVLTVTAPPGMKEPTNKLAATLTPLAPRPGGTFEMSCKGLPEGSSLQASMIASEPKPYQLSAPGFTVKSAERTIKSKYSDLGGFSAGSTSKFDLAFGAFAGGLTAAANGGNVGDVFAGAAKGAAATALGETLSEKVGLESPGIGTNDKYMIALGALSAGVKSAVKGDSVGDVLKKTAGGAAQTALGKDVSNVIGLEYDEDVDKITNLASKVKDAEDTDSLQGEVAWIASQSNKEGTDEDGVGPSKVTFGLNAGTPPGKYTMRMWISGKEDTACEARFVVFQ